ncbi:hypothetical protein GCM10028818_22440 [Spirosoma horti]
MKHGLKTCFFLLIVACSSREPERAKNEYHDIGTFDKKVWALNQAITHLSNDYGKLPPNAYHKVRYTFRDAPIGEDSINALWYHKDSTILALEVNLTQGISCRWSEVSHIVLAKAAFKYNSLLEIDSLSKPKQPLSQCL